MEMFFIVDKPEGVTQAVEVETLASGRMFATVSNGKRYPVKRTFFPAAHHTRFTIKIAGTDWSIH